MAFPVYSALLWELIGETGTLNGPGPAAGFLWVVRDIEVGTNGQPFANAGGFAITDAEGGPIFVCPNGQCPAAMTFSWRGRQIVEVGDHLRAVLPAVTADVRISGYQLTTP